MLLRGIQRARVRSVTAWLLSTLALASTPLEAAPARGGAGRFELAGTPADPRDRPPCRRVAAAMSADPRREQNAQRADPLFARWERRPDLDGGWQILAEIASAPVLNDGQVRAVHRRTYTSFHRNRPWTAQDLFYLPDPEERFPTSPEEIQAALKDGRMVSLRASVVSQRGSLGPLIRKEKIDAPPAGRHFTSRGFLTYDEYDLVVVRGGPTLVLVQDYRRRTASAVELLSRPG